MTDPVAQRRQRLTGIGLMCGAVAAFSCIDATGKYLMHYLDPVQVVWARYTGAFVLAMFFLNPISKPGMMVTRRPWMQIGRSALLVFSTGLNFLALRYLQLDEVLSVTFATPFLVAILSGPILGEWVGWRRWIAISVGFAGVLLVARPGFGGIHPAALFAVGSTMCYAVYVIVTRILARTDSTETTLFYSNRLAPASTLAPFIYTQMVWTATLGFLVFGDVPHFWTIIGGLIVVGSGLYLLNRERKVGTAVIAGGETRE